MNLYILVLKENVKQRWLDISGEHIVKELRVEDLSNEQFSKDSCLLMHLDSFNREELKYVANYWEKLNIIVFSDNPNDAQGIEFLLRGFKGYLNTFVSASIFEQLLVCVSRGDIWAGESIIQNMLKRLLQKEPKNTDQKDEEYGLSDRERETVNILITGASNKEIGRKLGITERTVKAHVSSILKKTSTTDRVSLIIKLKDSKIADSFSS